MKRLAAVLVAVIFLSACSPAQIAYWVSFARPVDGAPVPCAQWVGTSRVAGFTDSEIRVEHVLMSRESGCDPTAYNRSGAIGLMQVMGMWADDCGGSPGRLFDPQFNLDCAKHVHDVQGWPAWSTYRGSH